MRSHKNDHHLHLSLIRSADSLISSGPLERFHSSGQHLCKFIGTKESVYIRKEFNSHRIGLGTWPPFHCMKHQYGRRDVMWKHSFNDPIDSTVVTQPLLIGVTLDQRHQKTYVYHSCVFTGKRKKNSCFFSPACNAVSHDVEQNAVVLYPGFQRILFLIDTDGSRRSCVNEARSAKRREWPLVTGATSLISMQF